MTPTTAKNFKRLLFNQLVDYLTKYALLNKRFQKRFIFSIHKVVYWCCALFYWKNTGKFGRYRRCVLRSCKNCQFTFTWDLPQEKLKNQSLSINNFFSQSFTRKSNTMLEIRFWLIRLKKSIKVVNKDLCWNVLFFCYMSTLFQKKLEGEHKAVHFADDTIIICKIEYYEKNWNYIPTNRRIADRESTDFKCQLNRCYTFTNHSNWDSEFTFKSEVIKPAHACCYLRIQMDSNLPLKFTWNQF